MPEHDDRGRAPRFPAGDPESTDGADLAGRGAGPPRPPLADAPRPRRRGFRPRADARRPRRFGRHPFAVRRPVRDRATVDRRPVEPPAHRGPTPYAPPATILSRAVWRADESIRGHRIDFDAKVEKIVVHHTGTAAPSRTGGRSPRHLPQYRRPRLSRHAVPLADRPRRVVYEGRWARTSRPVARPER